MNQEVLQLPGVRLHVRHAGAGAPVILVHGYMVDANRQWVSSGVFDHLARHFRVIAFDNRGHGASEKFYHPEDYGLAMAEDVFRVMDAFDLGRAHVVGYSMGAMIVARCLALQRGRFVTATLGGGAGRFSLSPEDVAQNQADASDMRRRDITRHLLRFWPEHVPPPTPAQMRALQDDALAGQDTEALAAVRVSMAPLVVPVETLAAATEPMLGLVGTADPFLANLTRLKQVMPRLQLVTLSGASHADAPSQPGFHSALTAFLSAHA